MTPNFEVTGTTNPLPYNKIKTCQIPFINSLHVGSTKQLTLREHLKLTKLDHSVRFQISKLPKIHGY